MELLLLVGGGLLVMRQWRKVETREGEEDDGGEDFVVGLPQRWSSTCLPSVLSGSQQRESELPCRVLRRLDNSQPQEKSREIRNLARGHHYGGDEGKEKKKKKTRVPRWGMTQNARASEFRHLPDSAAYDAKTRSQHVEKPTQNHWSINLFARL